MKEEIIKITTGYEKGFLSDKEIIDWAIQKLMIGCETESLILLGSLNQNEYSTVRDLFKKAVVELGFNYPSKEEIEIQYSKIIAKKILDGEINPNEGCSIIGKICSECDWP